MMRVEIKPELLRWARERSGLGRAALAQSFPQLDNWERGESSPTLKQLESFAKATHTPVGYLFLQEPPVERIPIPDFRTIGNERIGHPSPDLLDTVYICQQRQEWYRDFARSEGEESVPFVGSTHLTDDVEAAAATIRRALGFDVEERRQMPTWTDALRRFIEQADALGALVMVNGVVGSNNRRKLDPQEFRGFALADNLAPLVFINGADTKAAQMFTLAHELAHIWLGLPAVSDTQASQVPEWQLRRALRKPRERLMGVEWESILAVTADEGFAVLNQERFRARRLERSRDTAIFRDKVKFDAQHDTLLFGDPTWKPGRYPRA
jgi:transcriptional regulator with XRE-family HTH domain